MEEQNSEIRRVCVTGAGGFIASWLVKLLLSKGYKVHGTVRDPSNEKNAHLKKLDKAAENLQLFKVDLLDYNAVEAAISGCEGVFHVASPIIFSGISDPEVELIRPAVVGTKNILKACSETNVKRVVVVSSLAAVAINQDWPKGTVMDESCWSDEELCRATEKPGHIKWECPNVKNKSKERGEEKVESRKSKKKTQRAFWINSESKPEEEVSNLCLMAQDDSDSSDSEQDWYCLSKTMAEKEAFKYAQETGLDVVTVCPSLVFGPLLQSTVNFSSLLLVDMLKGSTEFTEKYRSWHFVDVRDVVDALLLVYEKHEASGRYICTLDPVRVVDLNHMLKNICPGYKYPENIPELDMDLCMSSEKLRKIGWKSRTLEETIADSVQYYQEAGLLNLE